MSRPLAVDVADDRFPPYLSLHELEALVLAAPADTFDQFAPRGVRQQIANAVAHRDPELVNEANPPSRYLTDHWPGYVKPVDGPGVVAAAGLDQVRRRCPHFDDWLTRLERLAAG
jgi:hypothetical protein